MKEICKLFPIQFHLRLFSFKRTFLNLSQFNFVNKCQRPCDRILEMFARERGKGIEGEIYWYTFALFSSASRQILNGRNACHTRSGKRTNERMNEHTHEIMRNERTWETRPSLTDVLWTRHCTFTRASICLCNAVIFGDQ